MLFKFQLHIEQSLQELGLVFGFNSMSAFSLIMQILHKINERKIKEKMTFDSV